MHGNWIKMRTDLDGDPAVHIIRARTGLGIYQIIGRLHKFWSWADAHAPEGVADGMSAWQIDKMLSHNGFAQAMVEAGWLIVDDCGVEIPNFIRHNGPIAKSSGAFRKPN